MTNSTIISYFTYHLFAQSAEYSSAMLFISGRELKYSDTHNVEVMKLCQVSEGQSGQKIQKSWDTSDRCTALGNDWWCQLSRGI